MFDLLIVNTEYIHLSNCTCYMHVHDSEFLVGLSTSLRSGREHGQEQGTIKVQLELSSHQFYHCYYLITQEWTHFTASQ